MIDKIKFEDESGDKEFFTIIPNYVLNHSTQCDRDVYIQIKRITGEAGECFMSQKNLAKQCGISVNRLKKSLEYLLGHRWIINAGTKPVNTKGGNQYVNVYKVANLWELNMKYYREKMESKGVSKDDTPTKGVSQNDTKWYHENDKGVSPGDDKEYPCNNIPVIKSSDSKESQELNKKISEYFTYWKEINPFYKDWFGNKTQRGAMKKLLTEAPIEATDWIMRNLVKLNQTKFMPDVSSPWAVLKNFSKIASQIKKEVKSNGTVVDIDELIRNKNK